MDDGHEPYVPQLSGAGTFRTEYQLMYRDPDTGGEFTYLTDPSRVWAEQKKLGDAGFQVVVTKRQVAIGSWEIVERAA